MNRKSDRRILLLLIAVCLLLAGLFFVLKKQSASPPADRPDPPTQGEEHPPPKDPEPDPDPKPDPDLLPLSGLKIGIDAGHQAKGNASPDPIAPGSTETKAAVSSGATGVFSGIPEYEITLQVALKLQQLLEENGAEVIMVRETHDVDIPNSQRATMLNDAGVALALRIHCNSFENPSVFGALMMLPTSESLPAALRDESKQAGETLLQAFLEETGAKDMGYLHSAALTGFNWSTVPVCLIELGFLSNQEEDLLLASDEYQDSCAKGLYSGILSWYQP